VVWLVNNKIDLAKGSNETSLSNESFDRNFDITRNRVSGVLNGRDELTFDNTEHMFNVSAVVGTGVERLVAELGRHADQVLAGSEPALVTRERQRRALEDTQAALARALAPPAAGSEDLLAEELRLAARGLGRLTGRVDVEDILDVIFRDFCIGK
jgi:tRNA U34 5-carboxymethylaminomethyl modifying GTPase MnmE/TrmE